MRQDRTLAARRKHDIQPSYPKRATSGFQSGAFGCSRPVAVIRGVGYLDGMASGNAPLRRVDSADGKRYVELRAHCDLFVFEEFAEATDGDYTFIAASHCSGLYATLSEAERDMMAALPWLLEGKVR